VRWSRRRKSSQALALRSRIVLACADGADNTTVAQRLGCAAATEGKWRARFVAQRLHVGVHAAQRDPRDAGEDGAADRAEHVHDRADLT
jgi:hypothetical protein